jgi:hypothetical protein
MASTFTTLGIEKMATGENAGTWGDKTNTNLDIVNTAISGYVEQAVTSGGTLALSITDGASTATAQNAVIKLTGTITGNSIVTVPDSVEKVYIVTNGTSGAYTVQFKTASGTGITFGVSEKTTKLLYSDGTNIVDAGFSGALDIEGRELVLDADGDTTITADTDDQIDIKIAGADDFQFTANTFTAQSGSSIVVPESGLTFGSTAITSTAAELNLLDGVSGLVQADFTKLAAVDSTAAELNIVDGGTSATSTTVADADRVVLNDNGTMVQVAVTDLAAYFDDEITAMPNLTSVGTLTTLTVDNVIINGSTIGHTGDTDLITVASGVATVAGEISVTTLDIGGTNVTSTAAELNIMDGGTSATSTTVADADRVVLNDNGTMVQVAVTDLAAYFDDEITAMPNLVTTAATTVGALDSGSITSGFGTIDTGSSTITTTGLISGGSLDIDNVLINGTTIGHTDDTDLITLADGIATVAGEISVTTLDIGGTNVTTTAAEINLIDGGTSRGTTAVADGDGILINDAGTMRMTSVETVSTYMSAESVGGGNIVTTGALDSGSITSGFGAIDNGTSNIRSATITAETAFVPDASGGADLGTTALEFNDAFFNDGAVINFGDDQDTTLTHTDGTGLTLNSTNKLCFNDASQFIQGSSATVLSIGATDEIDLTATAVDLNGTLNVSGVATFQATPVFPDGSLALDDLDIDGGTDIGEALVDADLFIVDNGAGGTNRKVAASRIVTYIDANSSAATVGKAIAMAIVFG